MSRRRASTKRVQQTPSNGEIRARMIELQRALRDYREVWKILDPEVRAHALDVHNTQGRAIGEQWAALTRRYAQTKARQGYGDRIGVRTGLMLRNLPNIYVRLHQDRAFWVLNNRQHANYFQQWSRKTWGMVPEVERSIERSVSDFIRSTLSKFSW